MAGTNNAKCSICGRDYYMCLSCKDVMAANPWKVHTDTAEHYKIYQILRGYRTKVYTKDDAKIKLKNVDLSDLNTFKSGIKSMIEDILKEETLVVEATVVEPVEFVTECIETNDDFNKENLVVKNTQKSTTARKRNYKVDAE